MILLPNSCIFHMTFINDFFIVTCDSFNLILDSFYPIHSFSHSVMILTFMLIDSFMSHTIHLHSYDLCHFYMGFHVIHLHSSDSFILHVILCHFHMNHLYLFWLFDYDYKWLIYIHVLNCFSVVHLIWHVILSNDSFIFTWFMIHFVPQDSFTHVPFIFFSF